MRILHSFAFLAALALGLSNFAIAAVAAAEPSQAMLDGCTRGEASACGQISQWYFSGNNGIKDHKTALLYGERACRLKSQVGCTISALVYREAVVVPADIRSENYYLAEACDLGSATSCTLLGTNQWTGRGGRQNKVGARVYLQRACTLNYASACLGLANMVRDAEGGPSDPAQYADLINRACRLGEKEGCARARQAAATPARPASVATAQPTQAEAKAKATERATTPSATAASSSAPAFTQRYVDIYECSQVFAVISALNGDLRDRSSDVAKAADGLVGALVAEGRSLNLTPHEVILDFQRRNAESDITPNAIKSAQFDRHFQRCKAGNFIEIGLKHYRPG